MWLVSIKLALVPWVNRILSPLRLVWYPKWPDQES